MQNMQSSMITSATYFFVGIVEVLIGLRVLLKLFAASESAIFVRWMYDLSHLVLFPFEGMFPQISFFSASVFELSALFAMLVYLFLAYLVHRFLNLLTESVNSVTAKMKEKEEKKQQS